MGFNQRKPPDCTVCVAVDLSAAFHTVCHNKLLSKINKSPLPPTSRWLSSYLRGRQAKTCFRDVKSSSRKVHTGVPQGSKLSPSLFSFYIADMPTPTWNITNDIQGGWEIHYKLCCTCLEHKHTRHQLHTYPIHAKGGSEDVHRMSQDVQCQSPARGRKHAESKGTLRATIRTVFG